MSGQPESLCPCTAMPTPHRHVTAELPGREADQPEITVDPIPSRLVIKYWCGWGGRSHRVTATHFVHVAGKTVDYACPRHTDPKHWTTHGSTR